MHPPVELPRIFCRFGILLPILAGSIAAPVLGGVTPDGRLGTSVTQNGFDFTITAGSQHGGNLFHSFDRFDLSAGESATFQGLSSVQNILARVTGGSASSIDGTLRSAIPGANLYFINSAGVMFGPNAHLDITGSFTVTTADYVKLADAARFDARPGTNDLTLTSAPVSAFGFVNPTPAAITFTDTQTLLPDGQSFSAIGGDLLLDGATIRGAGSRVNLVSVRSAGLVVLAPANPLSSVDVSTFGQMGEARLTRYATIDTSGSVGGKVVIRGGKLVLDTGRIRSGTSSSSTGGAIDILAKESVLVTDSARAPDASYFTSEISTYSDGTGAAGALDVEAPLITISRGGNLNSIAHESATATGRGGDIGLRALKLEILDNFSIVGVNTSGPGTSGNIRVDANEVLFRGSIVNGYTGLTSSSTMQGSGGGNGGHISLFATGTIAVIEGAQIDSRTSGSGAGGAIFLQAPRLAVVDGSFISVSTVGTENSLPLQNAGASGNITLDVSRSIEIAGGSAIISSTQNSGTGGNILVLGNSELSIHAPQLNQFSGIFANSVPGPTGFDSDTIYGRGGSIEIHASKLHLEGATNISVSTFTTGHGGDLRIDAGTIFVSGKGIPAGDFDTDFALGIVAETEDYEGAAGMIVVNANEITVRDGGVISSSTNGDGNAGALKIRAGSLLLDGSGSDRFTGIFAASVGGEDAGRGGCITVNAGDLRIFNGAGIASSTVGGGDAGDVFITADNAVISHARQSQLLDSTGTPILFAGIAANVVGAETIGRGGNIEAHFGSLEISDGATITASTAGRGRGGSVLVDAPLLRLSSGASIESSTTSSGNGGMVKVSAGTVLIDGGRITATTTARGAAGAVEVVADSVTVRGPTSLISSESRGTKNGGAAGEIHLEISGALRLEDGARVSSTTFGSGAGGRVRISAGSADFTGGNSGAFTGISAETLAARGGGAGGDIGLQIGGLLHLGKLGQISADTFGDAGGGGIGITAGSVKIESAPRQIAGIFAEAGQGATGHGGNLSVFTNDLTIDGSDALISATSKGRGRSGNVRIEAGDVRLFDHARIASGNLSVGDAGSVTVSARKLISLQNHSLVTTSATVGDAGLISLASGDRIELRESTVSASAGSNGGSIRLSSPNLVDLRDSEISATAGAVVRTHPGGLAGVAGTGGNIEIDPTFIILDHSTISANAAAGQGGNISLVSDFLFQSESSITATGTTAGTVSIAAPELDLTNGLNVLTGSLLDASAQLRDQCARRLGMDFSSLLVLGRGGVSASPSESQVDISTRKKVRRR